MPESGIEVKYPTTAYPIGGGVSCIEKTKKICSFCGEIATRIICGGAFGFACEKHACVNCKPIT